MTDQQFRELIEASKVFKNFEQFKKNITLKSQNIQRLKIYYSQGEKYGIEYLRQNPYLTSSDVNLIASLL